MANATQVKNFIETIGPIIQKYAKERGYKIASTVIAQACCESAYGTCALSPYHNYFGMKCGGSWKGKSVNMSTKEEYIPGTLTSIKDNFRVYDSMEDGVEGYYDFINWSRYANLKNASTYKEYAEMLKADGYATSSTYVKTLCSIVESYGLTKYDDVSATPVVTPEAPKQEVKTMTPAELASKALSVIQGNYGVGEERKKRLGEDYAKVQHVVNFIFEELKK